MADKAIIAWNDDPEAKVLDHLVLQVRKDRIAPNYTPYRVLGNINNNLPDDEFYQTIDRRLAKPYNYVEVEVLNEEELWRKLNWMQTKYNLIHNVPSHVRIFR